MKNKILFKPLLVSTMLTLLLTSIFSSNIAMHLYPRNAFFIPLIVGVGVIILAFFLPSSPSSYFARIMKNPFFRIILIVYLIISTIFFLTIGLMVLSNNFYFTTPSYILIMLVGASIVFLTLSPLSSFLNVALIVLVSVAVINILQIVNVNTRDISIMLPLSFQIPKIYQLVALICYFFDLLIFYFLSYPKNTAMNKKTFILSTIITIIISTWFILDNYTYFSYQFFQGLDFPSLYRFKIYIGPKYLEHFDILIAINVTSFLVIKGTLNISLLRSALGIKPKFGRTLILTALICGLTGLGLAKLPPRTSTMMIPSYIMTGLIMIIYLYLVTRREKSESISSSNTEST